MKGDDRRSIILGFAGAGVLIIALLMLVDLNRVRAALGRADPVFLGVTLGFALVWLLAWAGTLRTVLAAMNVSVSLPTSFLVYAAAVFANNVTPFGQAGGEPVTALLVSKVTGTRYERGLVAIASVDVLNVVSSVGVVFLAVGIYASSVTLGTELNAAVGSVIVLVVGIVVTFTVVWRHRETLIDRIAGPIAGGLDRVRWGPFTSVTVTEDEIVDRMERFFGNVEVVATDRRRLALALTLSTAGWLLQAAALLAAFAAVGHDVPVVVALFVIPLANLAGMTPLPGGLGGIEAAFVGLLVPITGIEAAVVTAAVLVFRVAIYWMPVALGGVSATAYGVDVMA